MTLMSERRKPSSTEAMSSGDAWEACMGRIKAGMHQKHGAPGGSAFGDHGLYALYISTTRISIRPPSNHIAIT